MRRKTRGALINVVLFCGVLLLILYLNTAGSGNGAKNFAWRTVRYQTTASTLPSAQGVCRGLSDTTKPALVVARINTDDTKWLDRLLDKYHLCVYTADAPVDKSSKYLQVPENRGHEAMTYLTFIIDNYETIPSSGAVFVHGARWSWHNDNPDYDNAALLAALNISSALTPWGYHNLRCDWSASTCPMAVAQGSFGTSINAILEPWNQRLVSDAALPDALTALFGFENDRLKPGVRLHLGRHDAVRAQCCAQFVVSRESIHRHTLEEYVALRQWLLDGSSGQRANSNSSQSTKAAPPDDRIAGRIMSYVWHILFLDYDTLNEHIDLEKLNELACPSAAQCYCRLYGRCDLQRCTQGRCYGQYVIPPGYRLPEDWAATHEH
ncbi:uncharacterized protein PV06_01137 [Exophiala oligosperma]|uniref:Uncharacterized protein n=1 Tax=Exophiala oligosperma TaxID=215243 RepID=A0A0D2EL19_9EURO|nr:uncharacterized protein PV06_01137 [Exophiala oligosperma]KIW48564.1 hypothetical protein PV06_01137 [Exophiala oligosperma]